MTTARDVVKAALENLGVLAAGEDPSSEDGAAGLADLARLVASLTADGLALFVERQDSKTLTAAASFTIGASGADVSAPRPMKVNRAFVKTGGVDIPVRMRDRDWYMALADKSITSEFPTDVYYEPGMEGAGNGRMYVFPVPTGGPVLYWDSESPLTAPVALEDTLTLPPGYDDLLIYRLTKRLAPKWGKRVSPEVLDEAQRAEDAVANRNAAAKLGPVGNDAAGATGGAGGYYDWRTDTVR